jgi:hypothetical protein
MFNPLVSKMYKIIFFWNPKCACSTIKEWFFRIHNINVNLSHSEQLDKYSKCDVVRTYPKNCYDYTKIIVVRDPFSRIVSNYCMLYYNTTTMEVGIIPNYDYTFSEYVHMLQEYYFKDVHTNLQSLELENIKFDQIIYLDNFDRDMTTLCDKLGVDYPRNKRDGLNKITTLQNIYNKPMYNVRLSELKENLDNTNIIWNDKRKKNPPIIPKWVEFYNPTLITIVAEIYDKDIKRFNFDIPIL